jgi:hypothetical protein
MYTEEIPGAPSPLSVYVCISSSIHPIIALTIANPSGRYRRQAWRAGINNLPTSEARSTPHGAAFLALLPERLGRHHLLLFLVRFCPVIPCSVVGSNHSLGMLSALASDIGT